MAQVVIIGAGLTGLSTAYHLEKQGFTDYKLFEKEPEIGGLCRSVYQDGFTFDYTGHLLHINDDYFKQFIDTVVGFEHLNTINRRSFIYSKDTYTHYPFQVNLYGLPTQTITECIQGFIERPHKKNPANFKDWVLTNFGQGIAQNFFYPYQEKIFSYPVEKLSSSWTGRFVPQTTLAQMLTGALRPPQEQSIGYNAQFFYPHKDGIVFWVKKLYEQLKNPVYLNYTITGIDLAEKKVLFADGTTESYQTLISTIPLNVLLPQLTGSTTTELPRAARKLLCNSVVNFNLGINRPDITDKHWIYFPEKQYPFYRLGFSHNFSAHMAPAGCSALYGEFSHLQKGPVEVASILQECLEQTKKLLRLEEHEILTQKIITINHAYVTFDRWRDKNLPKILESLKAYDIHSIGRYGAWKYSSMQEGLLEGRDMAQKLVQLY